MPIQKLACNWVEYFKKIRSKFDQTGVEMAKLHMKNHPFVPDENNANLCVTCHKLKNERQSEIFDKNMTRLQNVMDAISILRGTGNGEVLDDFYDMISTDPPCKTWKEVLYDTK